MPVGYDKSKGDNLLEGDDAENYLRIMTRLHGAQENY
jgi:hypothetical protein